MTGNRLKDKVALVVGAGSRGSEQGRVGTGRAISILLAREGATVALMDFEAARGQETLDAIEAEGGQGFVLQGDATSEADCARVVAEAFGREQRLDVLVNNIVAWQGVQTPITDIDPESWDLQMELGLKTMVLMCKHAIPKMIGSGGGSIISVGSVAGIRAHGTPAYGAAKAGMEMLSRDIAFQYGRDLIRANVISPGHIHTAPFDDEMTPFRQWRSDITPLGIEGTAWDIAWTAVFLASDESRFISGINIPVDGAVMAMAPLMGKSDIITGEEHAMEGLNLRPQRRE
jgi:NAD(P)-dependent dehydrogenase (short-subunit alcohol dehydrogenase family)